MASDYYIKDELKKKYDRALLEQAEAIVAGRGDGRISLEDVEALYMLVADANTYTDTEKATMRYIRKHYNFTDAADEKFRYMIRSWAAKRGWVTRRAKA